MLGDYHKLGNDHSLLSISFLLITHIHPSIRLYIKPSAQETVLLTSEWQEKRERPKITNVSQFDFVRQIPHMN